MRRSALSVLVLCLTLFGCAKSDLDHGGSGNGEVDVKAQPMTEVVEVGAEGGFLERPFTADQIRDEWVPGLRILMRRSSPENQVTERWTVVASDDQGVDIEYATLDENGHVVDDPRVQRSTWVELRDHASFPAAYSTREWVARSTQLGDFEGWLYRVEDHDTGTVTEFFFAPELPGAPLQMKTVRGDTTIFELEQVARLHPKLDEQ
jgi:hypothetical protein